MKVQSPPCPWEFYICKVLQGRVAPVSRSLFLSADMLYLLPKHSVMLTPYGRRGTLQDMLNAYLRKGKVSMSCPQPACMADERLVPTCLSVSLTWCCQPIRAACKERRQAVCKSCHLCSSYRSQHRSCPPKLALIRGQKPSLLFDCLAEDGGGTGHVLCHRVAAHHSNTAGSAHHPH
jgi:hypothetical protein